MTASEREALVARVREQLEHWDSSGFEHVTLAVPVGDLRALIAAVRAETLREVIAKMEQYGSDEVSWPALAEIKALEAR